VAVGILSMIVLMMAAMFQQSNNAWRGGMDQAQGYMVMRSAVAMVQRDLARAVDADVVMDGVLSTNGLGQSFPQSFYILRPTRENGKDVRGFAHVTYGGGFMSRTEKVLDGAGGVTKTISSSFSPQEGEDPPSIKVEPLKTATRGIGKVPAMAYKITASLSQKRSSTYDIGALSYGPNGVDNTDSGVGQKDDDIRTWTKTQK